MVVRAGLDYQELGWLLPFAWYRRAAELVANRLGETSFVVFSDVVLAAEATAHALSDIGPAASAAELDPISQLHLIASMDHAVIADSSFAWWGAWLGDYRAGFGSERIVVAPDRWGTFDFGGIPPERWARLAISDVASEPGGGVRPV